MLDQQRTELVERRMLLRPLALVWKYEGSTSKVLMVVCPGPVACTIFTPGIFMEWYTVFKGVFDAIVASHITPSCLLVWMKSLMHTIAIT